MRLLPLCLIALMATPLAFGDSYNKRLTFKDTTEASLESFLQIINQETALQFTASDFLVLEERDLASSHYLMLAQVVEGVPVSGKSIRIWKDLATGELIQAEIALDKTSEEKSGLLSQKFSKAKFNLKALKSKVLGKYANLMATRLVKSHPDDNTIHGFKSMDNWLNGDLVRTVTVRGRRGEHKINISLLKNTVLSSSYKEFPQADKFMDIDAKVFPIYEEAEATHTILPRIMSKLKSQEQYPSRVLAHVRFVSWVPSQGGQINTTDKTGMAVSVWVNHPLDDRYMIENKGGHEAIRGARETIERNGAEWLGLLGVTVDMEMQEGSIINQPKQVETTIDDLGLRPVSSLVIAR